MKAYSAEGNALDACLLRPLPVAYLALGGGGGSCPYYHGKSHEAPYHFGANNQGHRNGGGRSTGSDFATAAPPPAPSTGWSFAGACALASPAASAEGDHSRRVPPCALWSASCCTPVAPPLRSQLNFEGQLSTHVSSC
jgi:hypothetical protein